MAQKSTSRQQNPVSDLLYDWLTVLKHKAEGLQAYEQYIRDAEKENSRECVDLFRRLHEEESRQVQEIKDHVFEMIHKQHEATTSPAGA